VNDRVSALAVGDVGAGPELFAGGDFTRTDGRAANHLASWEGARWSTLGSGIDRPARALAVYEEGRGASPARWP